MGAILGGTMRAPFTSIIFAFELTHDANVFVAVAGWERGGTCVHGSDSEALDLDGEGGAARISI